MSTRGYVQCILTILLNMTKYVDYLQGAFEQRGSE